MPISPATLLRRLEATRLDYGPGRAAVKRALLSALERSRLNTPSEVLRLHEHLCFLRAYPDDRAVLAQVKRMLGVFGRRVDLRRHRHALADSGIAGTEIRYRFFWSTARRLAARWPGLLGIDWDNVDETEKLVGALPLLVSAVEAVWVRARPTELRNTLARLSGARGADGTLCVRLVEAMPGDDFTREAFFDNLDLPLVLRPGKTTPARTHAHHRRAPAVFRKQLRARERPNLLAELARPPHAVRNVSRSEARSLIDLAQNAMVTRSRDLDAFAYGNERDVRIVDDGDGLQWAVIGMLPERRPVLRAAYGLLTLRNGVPIGYLDAHVLFRCVDIAYNTFEAFRGADSAFAFGRLLAAFRLLFSAVSFTLDSYPLGRDNTEAIDSGAWWFYFKLGFRPRNRAIRAIVRAELARIRASPRHRSSERTLTRLAGDYLYFETDGARAPYWPRLNALGEIVAMRLAPHALNDREPTSRDCLLEASRLLGAAPPRSAAARLAWQRWAPIITVLPGLARWSAVEKRALAEIVLAKGGRCESDYLARFDAHPRLGDALRRLTRA